MSNKLESILLEHLERVPVVSRYVRTRGWHYILAWCHRLAGLFLVAYLLLHLYTLNSLYVPANYKAKMKILSFPLFVFLEWLLSIPVILHALNGGRLILFESFGSRNDAFLIRCVASLAICYVIVLGLLMAMGNQVVSAVFFWLSMIVAGGSLAYLLAIKIWTSRNLFFWKLQRITAVFLLVMIPAHIIFTHLNPSIAHDPDVVILRMHNWFIKFVDLLIGLCVLYHAGYGIFSIISDYLKSGIIRAGLTGLIVLIMLIVAIISVKFTIMI